MPHPHRSSVRTALVLLSAVPTALAQSLPADRAAGAATVDVAACKKWLGTLASPEFEGRGTGQPGFQKAADYVAAHFKALGLEARGDDGSYFQHVPWKAIQVDAKNTSITFTAGERSHAVPAERLGGNATAKTSGRGEVVLLVVAAPPPPVEPVGGRSRRLEVPDIAGLDQITETDVGGKVVVVCVRTTDATRGGRPMARFAARTALQGKNAAAVVYADDAAPTGGLQSERSGGRRSALDATFGGDDLKALLAMGGKDAAVLAAGERATLVPLPVQAAVEVAVIETQAPAMNVWAVLPGADPQKKDEYVVIGSHLDHLGRRRESVFPGADDDGSGTTGVMAVAQMLAKNGQRPARSVLFVCFSGEELGLRGSRHFVDKCPIPLTSIVAELQMDMIGRDEEEADDGPGNRVNVGEKAEDNRNSLHLVGTEKLAPSLHALCLHKNETARFDLEFDQESLYERSDHYNFARRGVPVAFFFSGLHRDYHQLTDTPDKIHYEKLLRVATYVYDIAFELATQPERPQVKTRPGRPPEAPEPQGEPKGEPK